MPDTRAWAQKPSDDEPEPVKEELPWGSQYLLALPGNKSFDKRVTIPFYCLKTPRSIVLDQVPYLGAVLRHGRRSVRLREASSCSKDSVTASDAGGMIEKRRRDAFCQVVAAEASLDDGHLSKKVLTLAVYGLYCILLYEGEGDCVG